MVIEDKNMVRHITIEEQLDKINAILDQFVYSCSHDLKGPLMSIKGLVSLAETTDFKESEELLSMIDESVTRMDNFLKALESYVSNARSGLNIGSMDFQKLLNKILLEKKPYIDQHQILINIRIKDGSPCRTDETRMKVVLQNLIENALYFHDRSKKEKFIDIDVKVTKSETRIEICDNGEGISRDSMDKIFNMFYRASENSKGSGMGLFLVKETLNILAGSIEVQSSKKIGANFVVTIPNQ